MRFLQPVRALVREQRLVVAELIELRRGGTTSILERDQLLFEMCAVV